LGNFFTVREILAQYKPEVVRYFVTGSHYRSPLNYSDKQLDMARAALDAFYTSLRDLEPVKEAAETEYSTRFYTAMDDDFNTAGGLAVLSDLRHAINKAKTTGDNEAANKLAGELIRLADLLGLLQTSPGEWFSGAADADDAAEIDTMVIDRDAARDAKDWAEADRLRDELMAMGIVLEDSSGKTRWRRE